MGNFTLSEILTIAVIILIVFGPNRLPELARKAGSLISRARSTMLTLREEFTAEYGEVVAPMKDVRDDLKAVRQDLDETVTKFAKDVKDATDVSEELKAVQEDIDATVTEIGRDVQDVADEASTVAEHTDSPPPDPASRRSQGFPAESAAVEAPQGDEVPPEEATGTEGS